MGFKPFSFLISKVSMHQLIQHFRKSKLKIMVLKLEVTLRNFVSFVGSQWDAPKQPEILNIERSLIPF
jgi:hypothetical protein